MAGNYRHRRNQQPFFMNPAVFACCTLPVTEAGELSFNINERTGIYQRLHLRQPVAETLYSEN